MDLRSFLPMCLLRRVMRRYDGQLKQVIVLRTDLKMRRGKEIAQGAHASQLVGLKFRRNPFYRMWLDGRFTKVAVGIESEAELKDLYNRAWLAEVPCSIIQDGGKTEFKGVPTFTAVAVGPGDPEVVKQLTQHLKLR